MSYEDSAWVVAILSRGGGWYCGIDLIPPGNVPVHARVFDQESVLGFCWTYIEIGLVELATEL